MVNGVPEYDWSSPPPPEPMRLRGSYDDVIYWDGKRWWLAEYGPAPAVTVRESWPPWDFGESCIWRPEK